MPLTGRPAYSTASMPSSNRSLHMIRSAGAFLKARAENVAVGLLTALFLCFVVQIVSRYVFNRPLGWTIEGCLILWLWLVFWGSGLLVTNKEHVRFDVLSGAATPNHRRIAAIVGTILVVGAFLWSLPGSIDFVTFMRIEKSGTLRIPLDIVFSVFIIFALGVIVRQCWYLYKMLRGADPEDLEPSAIENSI